MDLNALTEDEWEELFGDPAPSNGDTDPGRRVFPQWAQLVAAIAVIAMVLSVAPGTVTFVRQIGNIDEIDTIEARAVDFTADARWGWLVADVVVVPLEPPNVGARVFRNPADGIVEIDHRSWDPSGLDQTMAHEIGHLLDFAVYGDPASLGPDRQVRGGLESEVWAECAAVFVDERSLDGEGATDQYRCRPSEYEVFVSEVELITEVCRPWDVPECRPSTE